MKAKTSKAATSMPDGNGAGEAGPASSASDADGAIGNMMPNDGKVDLAPEERGMPGLGRREPTGGMPSGAMEAKGGGRGSEYEMPTGSMGNGSAGLERAGGGGGSGGFGGGSGSGGGEDSGVPQVRKCGTMDVHRRLLSSNPEYAPPR